MRNNSVEDRVIVVGLDIGTTKICAVAADVAKHPIKIVGFGQAVSDGLNRGVVTNINSAARSIRKAIEECQQQLGDEIESVFAGIAGHHIQGLNRDGVVAVKGDTIVESDIQRVIEAARACNFPDKEILHTLTREFIVDGQDGVKSPIGMAGKRLEARVHLILGSVTSAANIVQCCNNANLNVNKVVLEPFASSLAVLDNEEKELGVIVLDIGGGTSDLVVYENGAIVYTSVLPLGGNQVTKDIAIGLRTNRLEALRVKHEHGIAMMNMVKKDDTLNMKGITGDGDRIVGKMLLAEVIEERFREIFRLIDKDIENSGKKQSCAAGMVLTGGSSLMQGIAMLAEDELKIPVRVGVPMGISGLNELVESPIYATGVGLVKYGADSDEHTAFLKNANPENTGRIVLRNLKSLVNDFFKLF